MLTSVSPLGNKSGAKSNAFTTKYAYDAFGDLVSLTDPLGGKTTWIYDLKRELRAVTDADERTTQYTYDADGRLTKTTRNDGTVLLRTYDNSGNLLSRADALNHATTLSYDALERLVSTTDPLGRSTSYSYDLAGNLTGKTDTAGRTTSMTYDAAGRLTNISYSDGVTPGVNYTYDALGRRTSMTDGSGASTWQYDSLGRVTETRHGAGQVVSYAYDLRGLPTAITYPNNKTVGRKYDPAGRLVSVSDWLGNTTTFKWNPNGDLANVLYPSGWSGVYQQDNADRLTGINYLNKGAPGLSFVYTRTNAGLLASESVNSASPSVYTYDSLARLTGVSNPDYAYDNADRVTTMPGAGSAFSYDDADQLVSGLGQTFTYDANGNRTQAGQATTYAYDEANRLISIGASMSYTYDGDGLRISKTNGGQTQDYTWQRSSQSSLPAILYDGASYFIYGPAQAPLEQVSNSGSVLFYHADQLGSTRMLTDSKGTEAATYTYDAYGNTVTATGQGVTNAFGYAGSYTDDESGLLYMHARYYDPQTAQFISKDPLFSSTWQAYSYAGDSPVNWTDPDGRFAVLGVVVGVAVVAGAVYWVYSNYHGAQQTAQTAQTANGQLQSITPGNNPNTWNVSSGRCGIINTLKAGFQAIGVGLGLSSPPTNGAEVIMNASAALTQDQAVTVIDQSSPSTSPNSSPTPMQD